ncbi:MAG: glycosyltransferase family 4 protein [Gemmatimonadetes bacterium]|nr:glycosyltransferase family 4 protein [Gemmatimonadota bacterium]
MKRIAVNARFLCERVTGVQRYAIEVCQALIPRLAGQGIEVVLLAPKGKLLPLGGGAQVVQADRALHVYAWEQLVLPRMVRATGADLLWSPCNLGPLAVARQVVTIHDASIFAHPEWFDWRVALLYRLLLPRLARRARRVLTDSHASAHDLIRHGVVPPEKLRVVYSGVGFAPGRLPGVLARPLPEPYFLTVSSLEPRKNLRRLLAAWTRIHALGALPEHRLVIVGAPARVFSGGALGDSLSPKVITVGYVPDEELQRYYYWADAFLYPSLYEGFGLPPLEAMVFAKPTLVSDTPSLREVCGDAALYCNPLSVEDIVAKVLRLATDKALRARLSSMAPARAANFTWDRAAEAVAQILGEVLDAVTPAGPPP